MGGGVEGVVLVGDVVAAGGVADFAGFDHAAEEETDGVVGEVGLAGDFGGGEWLEAFAEEAQDGLAPGRVVAGFGLGE